MAADTLTRTIFDTEHDAFRRTVRSFAEKEVAPNLPRWNEAGRIDRELFLAAGSLGLLGIGIDEKFGGGGTDDFRFNAVLIEELNRLGAHAVTMGLSGFNDLVAPYLSWLCTDEQKQRYLPTLCAGEKIGALAMTEPGAGSDLSAISTTARVDGDDYVVNGSKIFISNGILADVFVTVVSTDQTAGRRGFSILLVDADTPGLTKRGPLHKTGLSAQDTAELYFDDMRVPRANLLGEEGRAWEYLRHNLAQERLSIAVASMASARMAFDAALEHATTRNAFGRRVADFQANRFYLAELATRIEVTQCFVDRCIDEASRGALDPVTAAMAKWWVTEVQSEVVDRAVQLHGGYGYMQEYPVAREFVDARASRIYGGTTEIMKEIIGRSLVT